MLEGDDLAIEDKIDIELARLLGYFRKLVGDAFKIARKDLDAFDVAMKLRADAVEFVLGINDVTCRRNCRQRGGTAARDGGRYHALLIDKPFPNVFRRRLRTSQH